MCFMFFFFLYICFFFFFFFFSSRRRHTRSVSAFLLNRSSDLLRGQICHCEHFHPEVAAHSDSEQLTKNQAVATSQEAVQNQNEPQLRDENAHNDKSVHGVLNPTYQAGLQIGRASCRKRA